MFTINDDLSIYVTRGDIVHLNVSAESDGEPYIFKVGDVLRIKIFTKKDCSDVVFEKDFPITTESETAEIFLTGYETKIGGVINKHRDYWYEIELNPDSNPQTIIGYDDEGAKIFRLFPDGRNLDKEEPEVTPEDFSIMDSKLDVTSKRPVENQAIVRGIESVALRTIEEVNETITRNVAEINTTIEEVNETNADNVKSLEITINGLENTVQSNKQELDGKIAEVETAHNTWLTTHDEIIANNTNKISSLYNIGDIYVTSENRNPDNSLGGTWELIDKGFKNEYIKYEDGGIPENYFTVPEDSKTKAINIHCTRADSTVRLRLGITSEETFTDNVVITLGNLIYTALGFKSMPMGYNYTLATTDYANGALMLNINWETGAITVNEVLGGTEISSLYQGIYYPYYIDITFTITPNEMLDSFCDKFYWKRTA